MEVESVLEEVRRQSQPPPSSRPPRPAWRRGESQPLRVLVLSEDARTRRLRVTELLTAGFEVDWARDIEEALFRATCASPDVIVLDGPRDPPLVRQLLDHLASFEPTHRLPIILRSEFALPREVRDRCAAVVRGPEAGEQIVAFVQALAFLPRRRRERDR
jgi:CheY-like chemotaxis protein